MFNTTQLTKSIAHRRTGRLAVALAAVGIAAGASHASPAQALCGTSPVAGDWIQSQGKDPYLNAMRISQYCNDDGNYEHEGTNIYFQGFRRNGTAMPRVEMTREATYSGNRRSYRATFMDGSCFKHFVYVVPASTQKNAPLWVTDVIRSCGGGDVTVQQNFIVPPKPAPRPTGAR